MKKLLNIISLPRLLVYSIVLLLTPLFFIGYFYTKKKNEWDEITNRMISIHALAETRAHKQSINTAVRKKYEKTDPFYLDNQLESLCFLKKEREALEHLIQNPSFTENEAAEKRYIFLLGETNHFQFSEGSVHSGEGVQETTEFLAHLVEVDTEDIKEILVRIEGDLVGKPQLLITDFKLCKKIHPNENAVFELNLKLLKREFIQ